MTTNIHCSDYRYERKFHISQLTNHEIKTIADSGKGFEEGWEKKDYW